MITLSGIDIPETPEEMLLVHLETSGETGTMLAGLFSLTSRLSQHKECEIISDWLCKQTLIEFDYKYSRSNGNLHMKPVNSTHWHIISKRHHDWFYKLSSFVTTKMTYEYV